MLNKLIQNRKSLWQTNDMKLKAKKCNVDKLQQFY